MQPFSNAVIVHHHHYKSLFPSIRHCYVQEKGAFSKPGKWRFI